MSASDEEAAIAADAIAGYLLAHPDAADTAEGAARWWLRHSPPRATLDRALAMLVVRGLVEHHQLPDGTVVFRAGPALAKWRTSATGAPLPRHDETE